MNDQSEHTKLCAQLFKLNDVYAFLYDMKNKDKFEDDELIYAKKLQWKLKADIKKLERNNKKK